MVGIYCFKNKENNKRYIGQSVNIKTRYQSHITKAFTNNIINNSSNKFYNALNKYGLDSFEFSIIELTKKESLNEREQFWIEFYDSFNNGYNGTIGGKGTGCGENNPTAILNNETVLEIKNLLINSTISFKIISEQFSVSISTISSINNGNRWITLGEYTYPIRHTKSVRDLFIDDEVIIIRNRYIKETAKQIFNDYKDRCSLSSLIELLSGKTYKHIPVYHKQKKIWTKGG